MQKVEALSSSSSVLVLPHSFFFSEMPMSKKYSRLAKQEWEAGVGAIPLPGRDAGQFGMRNDAALNTDHVIDVRAQQGECKRYFGILFFVALSGLGTYFLFDWVATTVKGANPALGVVLMGMIASGLAYGLSRGAVLVYNNVLKPLLFTTVLLTREEPESAEVMDWVLFYMQSKSLFNTKNSKATFKKEAKKGGPTGPGKRRQQWLNANTEEQDVDIQLAPDFLTHQIVFQGKTIYISYKSGVTLPMATEKVVKLDQLVLRSWSPCGNHSEVIFCYRRLLPMLPLSLLPSFLPCCSAHAPAAGGSEVGLS